MKNANATTILLWIVYVALLAVLWPHTAWAFSMFEIAGLFGVIVAWTGAFAFEASIAALTHKLARHIEATPKRLRSWPKFGYRYLNAYSLGLVVALGVSVLANMAHAVEFGQPLKIFGVYGIDPAVYAVAFGAVLPLVSLLFARVLSNVVEAESEPDPAIEQANAAIADLRRQLRDAERLRANVEAERHAAEQRAAAAEARFAAAGDLLAGLFAAEKRQRILAARQQWPELPLSAIAIIAACSTSYASEVLSD